MEEEFTPLPGVTLEEAATTLVRWQEEHFPIPKPSSGRVWEKPAEGEDPLGR